MQSTRHFDSSLELDEAVAAFTAGNASVDVVAKAFYASSRVKRLIAHACFKSKITPDFADELTQELAVLLTQKFVRTIENPEKIYNVLHVSACHIARRKADRASEDSLDALLDRSGDADTSTSAVMLDVRFSTEAIDEQIDRRKAIKEFDRRFSPNKEVLPMQLATSLRMASIDSTVQVVERSQRLPRQRKEEKGISKEGVELNEIRKKLGYSIDEFSKVLNTNKGTLSSYLYGVVQTVPNKVLIEARTLCTQSTRLAEALQKLDALSMVQIVDKWLTALSLDALDKSQDAYTKLAKVLDVDRATVWRWRERNMRPDSRKLMEYEEKVTESARKNLASKQLSLELQPS
jgi:DNA-binding transcriptional regulator YiaG